MKCRIAGLNFSQKILFVIFLLLLSSCVSERGSNPLYFSLAGTDGKDIGGGCSQTLYGKWEVEQLHWFVSNFEVKIDGVWSAQEFSINKWQSKDVALLTLASPDCDGENMRDKVELRQSINWDDVQAVKFDLGVPFELNHLNPLQQPSPLNLPNMFWSWQMGHKFLRLDMSSEQGSWSFHLGSVGCVAATRVRAPETSCAQPNLYKVELPLSQGNRLQLDLNELLQGIELGKDESCMFHGHGSSSCKTLLNNLAGGVFH